jgi:hypothetical protein
MNLNMLQIYYFIFYQQLFIEKFFYIGRQMQLANPYG